MEKKEKRYERLPFALKQKVIADLDSGTVTSCELMKKYGIKSHATFGNWRKQVKRGYTRTYRHFQINEKVKVVNEILIGLKTKEEARISLDLSSVRTIDKWIEKYRHTTTEILNNSDMKRKNIDLDEDIENSLKQARLKILALEYLINTAERELNYPIRKKFGTKQ
jgi:transposase-like protein